MSSILMVLVEMNLTHAEELNRRGETTLPLEGSRLSKLFSKLTGADIAQIESSLDDLGYEYGFNVDFNVSDGEFFIRVSGCPNDDDQPPNNEDDPVQEIQNVDVIEPESKPKVMSAHG